MNYLDRPLVCKRLALSPRQSYRIVRPSYGALISSDEVLHVVNEARRGIREPLDAIPCDIVTANEIAKDDALNGLLTSERILVWTRRRKNVPPHFRFNKQTTRFSRSRFFAWLDGTAKRRSAS